MKNIIIALGVMVLTLCPKPGTASEVPVQTPKQEEISQCRCTAESRPWIECPGGGYFVIYPEPVSYSRAIDHYYHGCKGNALPSLYDYCATGGGFDLHEQLVGKGLPPQAYSQVRVFFSDSNHAKAFQKRFPSSELLFDDDGFWEFEWHVRLKEVIPNPQRKAFEAKLRKLAPEARSVEFGSDDAVITFGRCLSQDEARALARKVHSSGVEAKELHLKTIEVDL